MSAALWLAPERVELLGLSLEGVSAVAVDRRAARVVTEWGDLGAHAVMADVPEQRVTVRIVRRVSGADGGMFAGVITPGAMGELLFTAAAGAGDGGRRRVSADVVVTAVEHELREGRGGAQTITCVAVSADGAADPVTEEAA